jgi:hypothetical protein
MQNAEREQALKDKGNKPFHSPLIRSVLVGKLLEHEFFLVPQFDPNAHEHQWHRDDSTEVPEHDHGATSMVSSPV